MAEQAKQIFYVQGPCNERWLVVLHGKTIGVNIKDDEKYGISKEKWTQFCQSHRKPSWQVS